MPRTKILLEIFFLYFISVGVAQGQSFQTYTIQDGLVENRIRNIYQDKHGFIWVGTWEGLSRYDGNKFTNFTTSNGLSHDMVNDIMEDGGRIYIALNDGSVDYIENNQAKPSAKFKTALNKFIRLADGKVVTPTDENGLFEFSKGKFTRPIQQLPGLNTQFMVALNDSLLLTVDEGNGHLTILTNDYKQVATIGVDKIVLQFIQIYKDASDRIWLCTDKGLWLVTYETLIKKISLNRPPPTIIPGVLANIPTYSILESPDGGYWIGNVKGLIRLSTSADYTEYTKTDGLPVSNIATIFSDRENNVWLGTSKGLVKIITKNNIQNITTSLKLEPGHVGLISKLKNGKYIINNLSKKIKLFDSFSNKIHDINIPNNYSAMYYFPGSDPWIFYNAEGFYGYDTVHKKIFSLLKRNINPNILSFADNHSISFVGLWDQIGVLTGKKISIKNPGIDTRITAMTISQPGELWVGTWQDGLYKIQYSVTNDSVDFKIKNYSHLAGDSAIRSLYTDTKGNIWVGTRNKGIVQLIPQLNDKFKINVFNKKSGLYSNHTTAFAESGNGDIWVGSYYGLDKMIKTEQGYRIFNFSKINNFMGHVSQIIPVGKNEWWCVFENNLVKFTDHFLDQAAAITPIITTISSGNSNEHNVISNPDTTLSLQYSKNKILFEFSAPGFLNEKQILYSYRLLGGNDSTWSDPRNIHEVSYASLQSGLYNFEVRTLGWNNQYGKTTIFSFKVLSPFWQKWWFYTLCLLVVFLFFYGLYRYRLKQILKVQTVRNRIATDLHDDIGSNLTNIGILAELTHKNLNDQSLAAKHLQRIAEEINDSGQALDDIIWNINSNNDTLDEMIIRMRRYVAELFNHTTTNCQLTLLPGIAHIKIGMEQRRDLYLVFKESINNIYKHAAAKNVEVVLNFNEQQINLLIRDDGIGFDKRSESHRNGLKNLKNRVEKWNGKILISSGNGEGTSINLEMPLA